MVEKTPVPEGFVAKVGPLVAEFVTAPDDPPEPLDNVGSPEFVPVAEEVVVELPEVVVVETASCARTVGWASTARKTATAKRNKLGRICVIWLLPIP